MKRAIGTAAILGLAAIVLAMGGLGKAFSEHYKVEKDSALGKAGCALCHVSKSNTKLNAYGLDMQKAMKAAGSKKLTPAILKEIEKLDTNKNGKTNLEDIKADKLP